MDQNNNQQVKNRMRMAWIALSGGFVIIVILVTLLFYQPKTQKSENIQKSTSQTEQTNVEPSISPVDNNIDKEVNNVDLGSMDSDFQDVQKDINQL